MDNVRYLINKALVEEFGEDKVKLCVGKRGTWRYALKFKEHTPSPEEIARAKEIVSEIVTDAEMRWRDDKWYMSDTF